MTLFNNKLRISTSFYSLIYLGVHYFGDVFCCAILGITVGFSICVFVKNLRLIYIRLSLPMKKVGLRKIHDTINAGSFMRIWLCKIFMRKNAPVEIFKIERNDGIKAGKTCKKALFTMPTEAF